MKFSIPQQLIVLLAILFCHSWAYSQKLKLPIVGQGVHGVQISEVGFEKGYFYIDVAYFNDSYYSTSLSFDSNNPFYIKDLASNQKYALIEPLPDASKPIKVCDRCTYTIRIKFEKLPATTRRIDLIQGNRSNGWNFYNIDFSAMYPSQDTRPIAGTNFYGIIFDEELRIFGTINMRVLKNEVRIEEYYLKQYAYRDFKPFKVKTIYKRCGNEGKYCDENNSNHELYFTIRTKTDAYNLDADGFFRINGYIRYKFHLLDSDKYKVGYDWYKGQLWIGEKLNGAPNGYGALVGLQSKFSHLTDRANNGYSTEKSRYADYKNGYPYISIGKFENGVFSEGSTHIYYSFNKHSYSVEGYNKIVAPIVNGIIKGGAIVYRWSYNPYEEAFSNIYIGSMDGLFFADGEVKGYNFKNELAEKCQCVNRRLFCERLKNTIEEKKFAEFLGIATIAVAETVVLLKIADELSGPAPSPGRAQQAHSGMDSKSDFEIKYISQKTTTKVQFNPNSNKYVSISIISDGKANDKNNYFSSVTVMSKSGDIITEKTCNDPYLDNGLGNKFSYFSFKPELGQYIVVKVSYGHIDSKFFEKDEYQGIGTTVVLNNNSGSYEIEVIPK